MSAIRNEIERNEITFGIEIECFIPREQIRARNIQIGRYHWGTPLPEPFPYRWEAQADGSIQSQPGYVAVEIVSPPLKGLDGYRQIEKVAELLNEMGAQTNTSCGIHVHVGAQSILGNDIHNYDIVAQWIRNVFRLTSIHEHALYAVGNSPARLRSSYCHSVKSSFNPNDFENDKDYNDLHRKINNEGRYHTLNTTTMFRPNTRSRTIEFRIFAHTLHPAKMIGYVMLATSIAAKAATVNYTRKFNSDHNVNRNYANATHRLHCLVGMNYNDPNNPVAGVPDEAWNEYGTRVLKNQRYSARRFDERAPNNTSPYGY